mgnify:CR=1 FL=1
MAAACAEIRITGDLVCCVPDNNDLLTPFVLREQGDWFEDEIRFVRKLVQPGMHVVDIGANYGTYTLTLASLVGSSGTVHSFEPARQPIRMLRRSLDLNRMPWVTLHEVGLSDHEGTASLATSANPELNSLSGQQDSEEEIELITLDKALAGTADRISFIKMDAEGEEERILGGMEKFLAEQSPLIMFELKHGNAINEGLCEAFMRRGFLIHRLVPGPGVLAPIPLGESLDGYLLNAFAVRPESERMLIERGLLVPFRSTVPEFLAQIKIQEVVDRVASSTWLQPPTDGWHPNAGVPGWDDHRRAVALAASVDQVGVPVAGQVACLRQAIASERRAMTAGVTGSRIFTAARISFDLGYRTEAIRLIEQLIQPLMEGQDISPIFREPFLLPLRDHESLVNLSLGQLVTISALETFAWKRGFSAYFTGQQMKPLFERICTLPGHAQRSDTTLRLLGERGRIQTVRL